MDCRLLKMEPQSLYTLGVTDPSDRLALQEEVARLNRRHAMEVRRHAHKPYMQEIQVEILCRTLVVSPPCSSSFCSLLLLVSSTSTYFGFHEPILLLDADCAIMMLQHLVSVWALRWEEVKETLWPLTTLSTW
jgi:hypothetical protein